MTHTTGSPQEGGRRKEERSTLRYDTAGMDRFLRQWRSAAAHEEQQEEEDAEEDMADFIVDDDDDDDAADVAGVGVVGVSSFLSRSYDLSLAPADRTNRGATRRGTRGGTHQHQHQPTNTNTNNNNGGNKKRRITHRNDNINTKPNNRTKQQHTLSHSESGAAPLATAGVDVDSADRPSAARHSLPLTGESTTPHPPTPLAASLTLTLTAPAAAPALTLRRAATDSTAAAHTSHDTHHHVASHDDGASHSTARTAAVSAPVATVTRKRKQVQLADSIDADAELQRLIDSIDDEDAALLPARSISPHLIALDDAPHSRMAATRTARNLLGMLTSRRRNDIPFASMHTQRLKRLQEERAAESITDQHTAAATVDLRMADDAGCISSSRCRVPPSADGGFPFYCSSGFRAEQIRDQCFLHHSMNLIWSNLAPVDSWSCCGGFGTGVDINDPIARRVGIGANSVSYVNQIEFDESAMLFTATSNNAKLNLYDFDLVWMSGRGVERARRSRLLRASEERTRLDQIRSRHESISPPRAGHFTLRQPLPAIRPSHTHTQARTHEYIQPIFTMDLHPQARQTDNTQGTQTQSLRQIDTQRWNPYHQNEIALSSHRNNQIFMSAARI